MKANYYELRKWRSLLFSTLISILILFSSSKSIGFGNSFLRFSLVTVLDIQAGDAEGFGGGDPIDLRLMKSATDIIQAFEFIRAKKDLANLCHIDSCPVGALSEHCSLLLKLTPIQKQQCRSFIQSQSQQILNRRERIFFQPTGKQIVLKIPNGMRKVSMVTRLGIQGPIRFHRDSIRDLSRDEIIALLGHELGHKVLDSIPSGKFLKDHELVENYSSGREFLDTIGSSLAIYLHRNRVPLQSPPALPKLVSFQRFCKAVGKTVPLYLLGLGIELMGKLPDSGVIRSWGIRKNTQNNLQDEGTRFLIAAQALSSDPVRKKLLTQLFENHYQRKPNLEELAFFTTALGKEGTYNTVLAALMGASEYAQVHQVVEDEKFLVHLYRDLTGKTPTGDEMNRGLASLSNIRKPEFIMRLINQRRDIKERWIEGWYKAFLNRMPYSEELQEHLKRMQSGMGWESIQASLLATPEYLALQKNRSDRCKTKSVSLTRFPWSKYLRLLKPDPKSQP